MCTLQATAAKNARLSAMEGLQTSARDTAHAMTMGPASAGRNLNSTKLQTLNLLVCARAMMGAGGILKTNILPVQVETLTII